MPFLIGVLHPFNGLKWVREE
jgi:hypothetical protein